ncbi:amino acid/polyamine transporter I [Fusarium tricinctum]|uniref:Amino acid/polyamine transporter I n=1 Tax=Fusarium tricinctum TaxID=61284 RepID=A0A8K0RVA3_9HYPO|nr:amino acid/polyamine transporter I [Fusarium tricinctum]
MNAETPSKEQKSQQLSQAQRSRSISIMDGDHQQIHQKPFTVWTAMGIGHSITNTAITLIVGLGSGIALGGPPLFIYGFLFMAVIALCVAISLGELSSALPHSGGQYYWVAVLAPPRYRRFLSYATGIIGWAGAVCTSASVCLVVPTTIFSMVSMTHPDFNYKPWMGFVGFQVLNLLAFGFNCFERVLPWVSRFLLVFTICTVTAIFVGILAASPQKQSAENLFVNLHNISGWPNGVAFMIGLNAPNWAFSCLDATVHLADEIPNPRRNIPKALLVTVALGTATGLPIILALFLSAPSVDTLVNSTAPSLQIFYDAFKQNTTAALGLQSLVLISAAGAIIGIHTWQSRIAWAFSKDKGFPFHRFLSQIAPEPYGTPIYAHIWSSCWTAVLGCIYMGSQLAFNSLVSGGILLQYITYSTCIACLLYHGRSNITPGPFWYPKVGLASNVVVLIWTSVALVFYCFPSFYPVQADMMNYVSCVLVGVLLYSLIYWVAFGKKEYKTPELEQYD